MLVVSEPKSTEPIDLLTEILEAHGLTLKPSEGVYFVVRNKKPALAEGTGSLLVISRNQDSELLSTTVHIRGSPMLSKAETLGLGVIQYTGLEAGHYSLNARAIGFQTLIKSIEIRPMEVSVLNLQFEIGTAELEELTVFAIDDEWHNVLHVVADGELLVFRPQEFGRHSGVMKLVERGF